MASSSSNLNEGFGPHRTNGRLPSGPYAQPPRKERRGSFIDQTLTVPRQQAGGDDRKENETERANFDAVDTDGNGIISLDEWVSWFTTKSTWMARSSEHHIDDTNSIYTSRELNKLATVLFMLLDTDGNGSIDQAEFHMLMGTTGPKFLVDMMKSCGWNKDYGRKFVKNLAYQAARMERAAQQIGEWDKQYQDKLLDIEKNVGALFDNLIKKDLRSCSDGKPGLGDAGMLKVLQFIKSECDKVDGTGSIWFKWLWGVLNKLADEHEANDVQ